MRRDAEGASPGTIQDDDPRETALLNRQDRLRAALTAAFTPVHLEVADDSAQHAGHAGSSAGGETHYTITMVSSVFAGQSRVARSRAVHALLDEEFKGGLHALSLKLRSPSDP